MSGYDFDGVDAHEESVRISGRVKWFDPGKGYGFIVPDDPSQTGLKDVLLHVTSLRQAGRESALEGATISCDVVKRPKGWQVSEIHDLDETSASPSYLSADSADWRDAPEGVDVLQNPEMIRRHFPAFDPEISTILHIRRAGDISGQGKMTGPQGNAYDVTVRGHADGTKVVLTFTGLDRPMSLTLQKK